MRSPQVALLGMLVLAPAVQAQTVFTDRATWQSSVINLTNIDFSGIAPANGIFHFGSGGVGGVTFSSPLDSYWAVDPGYAPVYYDWGTGAVMWSGNTVFQIFLLAGTTAFGIDFGAFTSTFNFAFRINGGATLFSGLGGTRPDWAFFGVTSATDIATVEIAFGGSDQVDVPVYDNLSFGTVESVVPEPATVGLLAIGLLGMSGISAVRRRRRQGA